MSHDKKGCLGKTKIAYGCIIHAIVLYVSILIIDGFRKTEIPCVLTQIN